MLYQDRDGSIWVGTEDAGLNRFHPDGLLFGHLKRSADASGLSDNRVTAVAAGAADVFWAGTDGGIVNKVDRSAGDHRAFPAATTTVADQP